MYRYFHTALILFLIPQYSLKAVHTKNKNNYNTLFETETGEIYQILMGA